MLITDQDLLKGHSVKISFERNKQQFVCRVTSIKTHDVSFTVKELESIRTEAKKQIERFENDSSVFRSTSREEVIEGLACHYNTSLFRKIIDSNEIEALKSITKNTFSHPLVAQIKTYENTSNSHPIHIQSAQNTEQGLMMAYKKDMEWIKKIKNRLTDTTGDNFSAASSALAELRAYGELTFAGWPIEIKPTTKTPTSDFFFIHNDKKVNIEVHTKLLDNDQLKNMSNYDYDLGETVSNGIIVSCKVKIIDLFGKPNPHKLNDGITTNMISKLCSTKQKEHQLCDDDINILWIDLQDVTNLTFDIPSESAFPLYSDSQNVISNSGEWTPYLHYFCGGIWHAFYGTKGDIVLEDTNTVILSDFHEMQHNGRFYQEGSKVNFAVLTTSSKTIVIENYHRAHLVPEDLRFSLLSFPHFSIQESLIEISPNYIQEQNKLYRAKLKHFLCFQSFKK